LISRFTHRPTETSPTDDPVTGFKKMAEKYRDNDDTNEALDPELLYSKEYCIGWFNARP
jgi:hypothetical protein